MNDDLCVVTINGVDYYVPSNYVQYINNQGINTGTTSFTGYPSLSHSSSSYPQIRFSSLSYPVLYQNYNNYHELQNPTVVFSDAAYYQKAVSYAPIATLFLTGLIFVFICFRRFK